jgi:hypothetical protein
MASCGLAAGAVCAKDKVDSADSPDNAAAKIDARIT